MEKNLIKNSIDTIVSKLKDPEARTKIHGASGSEKAFIISGVFKNLKEPLIVVVPTAKDAEIMIEDLKFYAGNAEIPIINFSSYNLMPFKPLSYHSDTAAGRIKILYSLIEDGAPSVLVTTVDSLLQKIIPRDALGDYVDLVMINEEIDRDQLIAKLIAGGYTRTTIVEEPGDYCVRGGIIDFFSPLYDEPVRLELFGDMVDSLRFFSTESQRKTGSLNEAVLLPAKEAILKRDNLEEMLARVRKQASKHGLPATKVREIVERIKQEGVYPGIESLLPLVYGDLDTLFDYVSGKALFIISDSAGIEKSALELEEKASSNYDKAVEEKRLCAEPENLYTTWETTKKSLRKKRTLSFELLDILESSGGGTENSAKLNLPVEDNSLLSGNLKNYHVKDRPLMPLVDWIEEKKNRSYSILIACSTMSQVERVHSLLGPYGIVPKFIEKFPDRLQGKGIVYSCLGHVSSGFVWSDELVALVTEDEIFGAKRRVRKRAVTKGSVRTELLSFDELNEGDIIVHQEHGLGQYHGLEKITMNGVTGDYLNITYRDDDRLYLPVDRMGMVQKYVGVDGFNPVLDKMGGKSWSTAKEKAKKAVEKMAGELLNLYAERTVHKGHSFSSVDRYFQDFEATFPFEETKDQLRAIDDVLKDMEDPTPMDRLVCGDVGYGKTEVALRASFKAVNDGKQVAVLVPTTVLAEQHLKTFRERYSKYPVNVEGLSRFRTPKQQREILASLKEGKTDIVIGTHRLLQKDVDFRDLGLIVVDEEQRFGVKHKEKLKKIRSNVDVLTLTATPIPRTLHMSMMGIRDISVISTPPEQRQAIISYISEFDDNVISDAVRKELARKGQVFFIHNNINTIYNMAEHLKKVIPEVKLGIAHGRMNETELEKVMFQFINKEIDMLVCTTIVESGLDIPSANTMLINRADRFGLSQIYQLRGRVGRGDEQAYAYLFIPEESVLGKDAQKRLKVLMEYSGLGAGFQLAMSDLQLRGGGAILGASQSGHIAALGYDMFLKLMENAVADLKGEPVVEDLEPEINVTMSAFLPEDYIPEIDQRLSTYRKLARVKSLKEISDIKEEMIDRYGKIPTEATNILLKIMLRVLAVKAGVKRLDLSPGALTLYFSEVHQKNSFGVVEMVSAKPKVFEFISENVLKIRLAKGAVNSLLGQAKNILKELAQRVNS